MHNDVWGCAEILPHAGVQISNKEVTVKPKFATHNVEKEVSLFY